MLVDVLTINISSLAVLWYKRYRPENWSDRDEARGATTRRAAALVVAVVALSLFLGGVTYDTSRTGAYEEAVHAGIDDVLESPQYADLTLIDVEVEYTDPVPLRQPERISSGSAIPSGPTRRRSSTRSGHWTASPPIRRSACRPDRSSKPGLPTWSSTTRREAGRLPGETASP